MDARSAAGGVVMPGDVITETLRDLERELAWFVRLLDLRLRSYFPPAGADGDTGPVRALDLAELPPPDHGDSRSPWASFLRDNPLDLVERAALVLAMVPHLRPRLLDVFFTRNATFDRRFTEFGGARLDGEFEPTGETLAFLLGGDALDARLAVARVLEPDRRLIRGDVLRLGTTGRELPAMKAPLRISPEHLSLFTLGRLPRPVLSADFPAQRIETALDWSDLILHPGTRKQLGEIQAFITHGHTLMRDWNMAARLRPGHRTLFHGPPGTGKTLTAALLGKTAGRDVYRVDLSLVISKYIGETEKNLARVFDRAQQQDWIVFFDEADALFGKRTETKDAHDRYANQEVAYLLQRLETFDGVVVLASNMRENLDPAFTRRFESVIYFPLPRPAERLELWRRGISPRARLDAGVDLAALAEAHELSGGSIMNVIRQVSLAAIADGERPITADDLQQAIRRELAKDGKRP
ncbi:MAG TPA: ATP-binding protein [Kofleriaceae bacterium]